MIELKGVHKNFGSCVALSGVDIQIERGSIHGLVGENGAGKSTAMNVLYGLYQADQGQICIDGETLTFRSPTDAMAKGIGMVHQHFMLAEVHTALDNIMLGAEPSAFSWLKLPNIIAPIDRDKVRNDLVKLISTYGFNLPLDVPVSRLPVGSQQQAEILKLLFRKAEVLILDEPTAVLTPQESKLLFGNLQRLKEQGKTIVIVTHKLKEIMSYTDRVSVMRHGKVVAVKETATTSADELASLMVGRKIDLGRLYPRQREKGAELCRISGLTQASGMKGVTEASRLKGIDLSVHRGEILGIAGVEGNGQSNLIHALRAPGRSDFRSSGDISFDGVRVEKFSAKEMRRNGLAIIPENRLSQALLLHASLAENLLLSHQSEPKMRRGPFLSSAALKAFADKAIQDFDIRPKDQDLAAMNFSGGNQQKIVVARECEVQPKLLIAAQPTRGVDIGASEFIHEQLIALRDKGVAILLVSSDLDEIFKLSDRIVVFYEGKIKASLSAEATSQDELGRLMGGALDSSSKSQGAI